ncbi:hypothetical protein BDM02DRAFT_380622 [Thelephora ganbajun]|uniref:Uncharacterized protein n=1 Tax=Thelephora ganbajun TaxID=370292 RepID=A0ACB6ZA16_THEGA|nr:hypothetical protein BDM02DRAFT_380622 [Thelephora ganbajun]
MQIWSRHRATDVRRFGTSDGVCLNHDVHEDTALFGPRVPSWHPLSYSSNCDAANPRVPPDLSIYDSVQVLRTILTRFSECDPDFNI